MLALLGSLLGFASDGDATDTTYDLTVGRERSGNTQV